MDTMPMPGGGAMPMAWMPMCGQCWIAAAASFLAMWTPMMAVMMLPSWVPMLWRYYRRSVGRAGEVRQVVSMTLVGAGYLLVWTLLGAAVYPLGTAIMAVTMRYPAVVRAEPIFIGLLVLTAGALQFTRWKAHHLACCRDRHCHQSLRRGPASPPNPITALRHGLRLGLHCSQCCAGLTAVLLVAGIMDAPAMLAVTAGITLERLAPAGERVARGIGIIMIGAGFFLVLRAGRLG